MSSDSADPFYWMRVILASNRGVYLYLIGFKRTLHFAFFVALPRRNNLIPLFCHAGRNLLSRVISQKLQALLHCFCVCDADFVLQVLWWSWVSHPLSPQASSCSCWLVPRSLRWETLLRTEPSSTELRNVGSIITHQTVAIFRSCHVPFWSFKDVFDSDACTFITALILVVSVVPVSHFFMYFCSVWNDHHHWTGYCVCHDWHVWRSFRDGCWDMLAHHHPG